MDDIRPQRLDSQFVIDELTAVCNSLGKIDENDGTYMKDRDCKACLREMLRYISTDDDKHVARCSLGALNVIKSDLIPLMVQYCDYNEGDPELFTTILRICTSLTTPVLLLFQNQEMPTDVEGFKLYNKLLNGLHGYKEAFATDFKIWPFLNKHLRHNRDDETTFERLIVLIRNIMHIPVDATSDKSNPCGFDAHDMCLNLMDKSGLLATLIEIASESQKGTEFCFHITEIIYLMLRDQNPENLALARPFGYKRKLDDTDLDKKRLAELSERNRREKRADRLKCAPPRFRQSSFLVQNCRSLSEAPMVVRRPVNTREGIEFYKCKTDLRKAKNKKPLSSETSMIISDTNAKGSKVAYSLKVFCRKFVEKIYNNYMQQIKHNLIQKRAQEDDEIYYLWTLQFFSAFNRHMNLSIDNVSETLSTSTLHFIQVLITSYQDKIKIEKTKFEEVSKRLHMALRAYGEILNLIKSIDSSSEFAQTVGTIKKNVFTELEYSTLMLTLFQQYDEPKHSSHYLVDLIQTNNTFLELLEEYSRTHEPIETRSLGEEEEEEEEDGEKAAKRERKKKKKEADFRTAHFTSRYCCPDVINSHIMVLRTFRTNSDQVNLAILKFLERIFAINEVILFQASIFKCLVEIMEYDPTMVGHEGFCSLGKNLISKFGSMSHRKRWMFQELLFWKTCKDVVEIESAVYPPPAVSIREAPLDAEEEVLGAESEEATPADTIADLLAELRDSSDEADSPVPDLPELDSPELDLPELDSPKLDSPVPLMVFPDDDDDE